MKKIIRKQNNKNELWFNWLNRKFNSFEAFKQFDSGHNPEEVAENFVIVNKLAISKLIKKFDADDEDTLHQFQKLTECEWHIFRILKNQLETINKVRYVDFKKEKNQVKRINLEKNLSTFS